MPIFLATIVGERPVLANPTRAWTAYVTNFSGGVGVGTVSRIDTSTNTKRSPIAVGTGPLGIAIASNGATIYVANSDSNSVTPIDALTRTARTPISVSDPVGRIAITPNGHTLYVTNDLSVVPIDLATNTAGTPIKAGASTGGIAITPDGATAYVTNAVSDTVTPINTTTNTPGNPIPVGFNPEGIAITPDGVTAYVTSFYGDTVVPIDVATNTPGNPIPVGFNPYGIAITPNGLTAYVTNFGGGTVTPIDTVTNTAGAPIPVGKHQTVGIAITPDGKTAYATNEGDNTTTPVDTATNKAKGPIRVGQSPFDIAITPDQAPVAHLSVSSAEAGKPTVFDASDSTVAFGTISTYAWNFGDGSTAGTSVPTTTHTYATSGPYAATVTETDSAGTSTTQVFTGQTMSRNGGPSAVASQSFTVARTLAITTNSVPPGQVNVSYATVLRATGGNPPYKWTLVSGRLPTNLHLHAYTGVISGKPDETGTFTFTVQVVDTKTRTKPLMQSTATKMYSLSIS